MNIENLLKMLVYKGDNMDNIGWFEMRVGWRDLRLVKRWEKEDGSIEGF